MASSPLALEEEALVLKGGALALAMVREPCIDTWSKRNSSNPKFELGIAQYYKTTRRGKDRSETQPSREWRISQLYVSNLICKCDGGYPLFPVETLS